MIKQHIAIVIHDFNAGGTEAIAFRLAGEWLKKGRRVTIIAGALDGPMRERVPQGADIVVLDPPIPRSALSRLRLGEGMIPALAKAKPDLVFIPGNFHFILAHAIRQHFPNLPIVAKVSNPLLPPLPGPLRTAAGMAVRWLAAPINRLVYMSAELQAADSDVIGPDRSAILAEPNLPQGYCPLPRHGPQHPPLILAIARMEPQKNLALAIRAFAILLKKHDARLLILGEGRDRAALEALVQRLGIAEFVAMPGFASDIAEKLAQASLLLMTSRYEGFPAVLIEALAADVPVVSTNCSPSQKALIASPLHGRVVDRSRADDLAAAMADVLAGPFASNGERARGLERHASPASATSYLALFDSVTV
ncbi:MAG: hypothetical protein RLZZ136_1433 [Pseudomonadota bacterium]|jgi:glycosyltransferase involved in cell wall biosynthesis